MTRKKKETVQQSAFGKSILQLINYTYVARGRLLVGGTRLVNVRAGLISNSVSIVSYSVSCVLIVQNTGYCCLSSF